VVVGAGAKLFADGTPRTDLKLISQTGVAGSGVTILTYQPA